MVNKQLMEIVDKKMKIMDNLGKCSEIINEEEWISKTFEGRNLDSFVVVELEKRMAVLSDRFDTIFSDLKRERLNKYGKYK